MADGAGAQWRCGKPLDELAALVVDGQFFRTDDGTHTVIGCSDFLLFAKFVRGEDIADVVAERRVLGFNDLRVFLGMKGGLGDFDPRPHLDRLPEFCALLGASGLRLEFTFGDWLRWCPDPADQRRLLHNVEQAMLPCAAWTRIEGMNEGDNKANLAEGLLNETLDPSILWCLGSRIQDAGTMEPVKRYATYHPQRTSDWPRKCGHNAYEVANHYRVPCVSNETTRPDEDRRASSFFDAAANATLLCAGAVFHSTAGKTSSLFTDEERHCAEAWIAGANAVPLQYQRGSYTAGHLHDSPVVYRPGMWSHARLLGNEACLSVPQNPDGWVARNGWRIVTQTGSVIELERP